MVRGVKKLSLCGPVYPDYFILDEDGVSNISKFYEFEGIRDF